MPMDGRVHSNPSGQPVLLEHVWAKSGILAKSIRADKLEITAENTKISAIFLMPGFFIG